jgi:hypothetical protein
MGGEVFLNKWAMRGQTVQLKAKQMPSVDESE